MYRARFVNYLHPSVPHVKAPIARQVLPTHVNLVKNLPTTPRGTFAVSLTWDASPKS